MCIFTDYQLTKNFLKFLVPLEGFVMLSSFILIFIYLNNKYRCITRQSRTSVFHQCIM